MKNLLRQLCLLTTLFHNVITMSHIDTSLDEFDDASLIVDDRSRQTRSMQNMGGGKRWNEQDIIELILAKDSYDWRVRPRGLNETWKDVGDTGGPVVVVVNIYLRSISKIDDVNMEYSTQFTFREQWNDPRLAYGSRPDFQGSTYPDFVVLATSDPGTGNSQQIWMPDTFFQNEKEARRHLIDKPNVLIRIYPDGGILYSVRLSMVLSCPMSLEFYPMDIQHCYIDLTSYAYTTNDIKYEWKKPEDKAIQLKSGLEKSLPSFQLKKYDTAYCTSKTNTGEYSCLQTQLILRREFSYYLLQLYIPSFMLVIVSWVSFWLDKNSVPARVTLGVTTLLTMTTQSSGINAKLPPVSYTKAIDVWIGVCLGFIFGALLEFALVNYAAREDFINEQTTILKPQEHGRRQSQWTVRKDPATDKIDQNQNQDQSQPQNQSQQPIKNQSPYHQHQQIHPSMLLHQRLSKDASSTYSSYDSNLHDMTNNARHPALVPPRLNHVEHRRGTSPTVLTQRRSTYEPPSGVASFGIPGSQYVWSNTQYAVPGRYPSDSLTHQPDLPNDQHLPIDHIQQASSIHQHRYSARTWLPGFMQYFFRKYKERSKRIDVLARILFPMGFGVFNVIYWIVYWWRPMDNSDADNPELTL